MNDPVKIAKVVLTNGTGFDILTRMSHAAIEAEFESNDELFTLEAIDIHDDKVTFIAKRELIAACIVIKRDAQRAIEQPGARLIQ